MSPDTDDGVSGHYISSPRIVSIQSLEEGNLLTWKPVSGNAKYRVYVKSGKGWKVLGDTFDTSYIHSSQGDTSIFAQPGVEYTYTVACISINGKSVTAGYNQTGWSKVYDVEDDVTVYSNNLGNLDGDGEIGVIDATYIQRYVAGLPVPISDEDILKYGDIDGDGEVGVIDATYIMRYAAGLTVPFAIGE